MNEKTKIGCFFLAVAAFLYASKHITAALIVLNINSAQVNYFEGGYNYIKTGITFWTTTSFLLGAIFFIAGYAPQLLGRLKHRSKQLQDQMPPNTDSSRSPSSLE